MSESSAICPFCGCELASDGGPCVDCDDDRDLAADSTVQPGTMWLTRGDVIPRRVTVLAVDRARGWATVRDDDDGAEWCERVEVIESWTRRSASLTKMRAVRAGRAA